MAKQNGTLKEHAIWLHELFRSLIDAGFDDFDARELVAVRMPFFPGSNEDEG